MYSRYQPSVIWIHSHSMGDKARIKLVHTVDTGQNLVYVIELVPENFKVTEFPETIIVE